MRLNLGRGTWGDGGWQLVGMMPWRSREGGVRVPSWIMHLVVAEGVAAGRPDLDVAEVWLGALAPDASGDKCRSHLKGPRYGASDGAPFGLGHFLHQFGPQLRDPKTAAFYVGYWSHLVADDLMAQWLYFSGLKEQLAVAGGRRILYGDYDRLNARLVDRLPARDVVHRRLWAAPQDVARVCPLIEANQLPTVLAGTWAHVNAPKPARNLQWLAAALVDGYFERAVVRTLEGLGGSW